MENRDPRFVDMGNKIFQVLAGKGFDVNMYDSDGNQTQEPGEANLFWSNDLKMNVAIGGETKGQNPQPLVTFYTSDVTPEQQMIDIYEYLKNNNLYGFSFNYEPYEKTLHLRGFKDFKESWNWSGTTRSSYLPIDQVKVVIRHSRPWDKEVLDRVQRWRRIRTIMLHTPDGQRFKFPHNHVCGARAMAQHLSHNNAMTDDEGKLIGNLVKLLTSLGPVQRQCKKRNAHNLASYVLETRKTIKKFLEGMSRAESYRVSLDEAKKWSWDWKHDKSHKSNPEQRQLDEWFQQFDLVKIFEDEDAENKRLEQIKTAWRASNEDMYQTLDYLKSNVTGWKKRFETDPKAVTDEIEKAVAQLKKV